MITALCVILGIGCLMLASHQETIGVKVYPALYLVGGLLLALSLTLDPIGFLERSLRDNNDFARDGTPNYWVDLNTGKRWHQGDRAVRACRSQYEVITVNGVDLATCTLFGDGPGRLYAGVGTVLQIGQAMSRGGVDRVWPGQPLEILGTAYPYDKPRYGCMDIWGVDPNGNILGSATGLTYQYYANGQWSEPFQRQGNTVIWANRVRVSTPDDLPRASRVRWIAPQFVDRDTGQVFCLMP